MEFVGVSIATLFGNAASGCGSHRGGPQNCIAAEENSSAVRNISIGEGQSMQLKKYEKNRGASSANVLFFGVKYRQRIPEKGCIFWGMVV